MDSVGMVYFESWWRGNPIVAEYRCASCAATIHKSDAYCRRCGAKFDGEIGRASCRERVYSNV